MSPESPYTPHPHRHATYCPARKAIQLPEYVHSHMHMHKYINKYESMYVFVLAN